MDPNLRPPADSEKTSSQGDFWRTQLDFALKNTQSFRSAGEYVNRQYMGGRDQDSDNGAPALGGRYNLFTANVGVLQAMLYGSLPRTTVTRLHADPQDDVGRIAGMILDRALKVGKRSDVDIAVKQAVFDRITAGLGTVWMRYDVETETEVEGEGEVDELVTEHITSEEVPCDYVHWADLVWSPCRVWEECEWVARRHYLTKAQARKRWPEEADAMTYTKMQPAGTAVKSSMLAKTPEKYATVFEIWHRASEKIYWLSWPTEARVLEVTEVPYELPNFWPCPQPMRARFTTSNFTPRSDYAIAADQYEALHMVNQRITMLVEAVQVTGVYDKQCEPLKDMLGSAKYPENRMIPVDNWAMLAEKGGLKGVVDWFPIEAIVATIERLRVYRQDLENLLHELTGMSDILRGDTKASETLGAQQLKAQFANVRVSAYKTQVAEFIEEILQIKAAIMCAMYTDESWMEAAAVDVMYATRPQVQEALALLRDPKKRNFRINVSVDSLSQPSVEQDRNAKLDVIRATGEFLKAAGPLLQIPAVAPIALRTFNWVLSSFPGFDQIESVLDSALEQLEGAAEMAKQQPPQPSPEQQKVQGQIELGKAKLQMEQQSMHQEMGFKQEEHQMDMQFKLQEHQLDSQVQQESAMLNAQVKQQEVALDMNTKTAQASLDKELSKVKTATAIEAQTARARSQADKAAKNDKPSKAKE